MSSVGVMASGVNLGGGPVLHVWPDAIVPTTFSNPSAAYELGTGIVPVTGVSVVGVRIWNPGLGARASRSAKLWEFTTTNFLSSTKVREVALPDTMPTGWSPNYLFPTPYVTTSAKYLAVSYDVGGISGVNDIGAVASGLASAVASTDGKLTFPANGGMYTTSPDSNPNVNFINNFWGVDALYQ